MCVCVQPSHCCEHAFPVCAVGVACVTVFATWPLRSVNFILLTFCVGLWEEEAQRAHLMSVTWACHLAATVLTEMLNSYPMNHNVTIVFEGVIIAQQCRCLDKDGLGYGQKRRQPPYSINQSINQSHKDPAYFEGV